MNRTATLPDLDVDVRRARRAQRRQVRRASRERRAAVFAIAAMVMGFMLLGLSALWPSATTQQSVDASNKNLGPAASVPVVTTVLTSIEKVINSVETVPPGGTSSTVVSATGSNTIPPSPASTIALTPYVPPTIPPVAVAPDAHKPDTPVSVAVAYGLNSWNPHLTTGTPNDNTAVLYHVLPQPFRVGPRGDVLPDLELLAEAPALVPDSPQQIARYKINPEAKWSDGTPVSCDDFKLAYLVSSGTFTEQSGAKTLNLFHTAIDPRYKRMTSPGCSADGREVTVVFQEREPDWQWLFTGLLPSHVVKNVAKVADFEPATLSIKENATRLAAAWNDAFSLFPGAKDVPATWLSAGPFKAVAVGATGATFAPNPAFWGQPAGSSFTIVATGEDKLFSTFTKQGAHLSAIEADSSTVTAIAVGTGAQVRSSEPVAIEELVINFRHPQLQTAGVRQALTACIDQTSLTASRVTPTFATAVPTTNRIVRPFEQPGFRSTKAPTLAGVDKARELLTSAGFSFGADGLAAPKGSKNPLVLRVFFQDNALLQGVVEGLAQQCRPAGINLVPMPTKDIDRASAPGEDWDLALKASPSTLSAASRAARFSPLNPANIGSYNTSADPKVTQALATAMAELDPVKRTERWNELDTALWSGSNVPSIPLFTIPTAAVATAGLAPTVEISPGPAGIFGSARAWR
jgi:peptide/nickel transport system substrate-binding protein